MRPGPRDGSLWRRPFVWKAIAGLAVIIAALSAPAWSQTRTVSIDRDLRVFTMMAAINAAGFDVELAPESHPVRQEIRKISKELDPAFLARMRQFYATHKEGQPDEAQPAKYLALALTLSGPPDFTVTIREEDMPPEARSVARFADFLKEFFVKARIPERWVLARPFYDAEAETLGPPTRDAIRQADAYLRATSGTAIVRHMSVFVELTAPKNSVYVQSAQDEYFVIVGSSSAPRTADLRHAYLHLSVDAALFSSINTVSGTSALLELVSKEDGVAREYTRDAFSMARESLVRAIELRLDRPPENERREMLDNHYRSGLLFLPFFYGALPAYEQEEEALSAYLPTMLAGLRIKDEQKRFQDKFHQIPPPQRATRLVETPPDTEVRIPPPTPLDRMRALLVDASKALNAGETDRARTTFQQVLESYDPENGSALYGLALIAGKEGDDKAARKYFEGVTQSASAEPSIKVWAQIYLGRLDDLECRRPQAVEHYQEAIKLGDDTRNAQAIAREGVAKAFGDGCDN
ncbi:MAG TPA: tetratricopeptide repeat protein [Terriglobia bacterium]|nr:tetratricopeptide repeat protein [Terriglobia bacterium]